MLNKPSFRIRIDSYLIKINNKAKVRQSTRLVVLRKVKVINYKNLKEVWVKHTAKDKAIAAKGKGKHNCPHKNPVLEIKAEAKVDIEAILLKEEVVDLLILKNKVAQLSEVKLVKPLLL